MNHRNSSHLFVNTRRHNRALPIILIVILSVVVLAANCGRPDSQLKQEQTPICANPPTGMVSWWPGEGTGEDIVGGHKGVLKGQTTFSPGMVGQAFAFKESGDAVEAEDLKVFYDEGATFDAWFRTTDNAGVLMADGGGVSASKGMGLFIEPIDVGGKKRGQLQVFGSKGTSQWNFKIVGPLVDDDKFHHVAVTWTGKAGPDAVKLYFDGAPYGSAPAEVSIGTGLVPLSIGWHSTIQGYNQFQGLIDEVEIFNRALSAQDIKNMFDAGSAGKCRAQCTPPPEKMQAWWPGEGTGEDIVGGHKGVLRGQTTFSPGMVGQAFAFKESGDAVETEDLKVFYDGGATFDAWFRTTDNAGVLMADGGGVSASKGMGLFIEPIDVGGKKRGQLQVFGSKGTSQWNFKIVGPLVDDDKFHHVAVTWTGRAGPDAVKLYFDGAPYGSAPAEVSIGTGLVPLSIGWHSTIQGYNQFQGLIDEVEIFNRALSAQDIKNMFDAGSAGKCRNKRVS